MRTIDPTWTKITIAFTLTILATAVLVALAAALIEAVTWLNPG